MGVAWLEGFLKYEQGRIVLGHSQCGTASLVYLILRFTHRRVCTVTLVRMDDALFIHAPGLSDFVCKPETHFQTHKRAASLGSAGLITRS